MPEVLAMGALNEFVYVVNEDSRTRGTLCEYLERSGFATIACGSAAEYAIESASSQPACAILEVDLPDMSGLDLQMQLAAAGIPVVFVVAQIDVAGIVRALKAGAVDVLMSPLPKERLLPAVYSALEQHRRTRCARATLAELQRRHKRLTPREREVMQLIVSGLLNKQVALELGISETTVQIHRGRIMQKMRVRSFAHLVRMAQALELAWPGARTDNEPTRADVGLPCCCAVAALCVL
jgi:FixJ family two-component response regulator